MARASLVVFGLLALAALALAQTGTYDIFGALKDESVDKTKGVGVFAGKVILSSRKDRNATADVELYIAHPYLGAPSKVYFTTPDSTSTGSGTVSAGGIGWVKITLANATIFKQQADVEAVGSATLVLEYVSGANTTAVKTYKATGAIATSAGNDVIAGLNAGCAAPTLVIANSFSNSNSSINGKIWWASENTKATLKSGTAAARDAKYNAENVPLYVSATDEPVVTIDEVSGKLPVSTSTSISWPANTDAKDGFSTACTAANKTSGSFKMTLPISKGKCDAGRDGMTKAFLQSASAVSKVDSVTCAVATRRRGRRTALSTSTGSSTAEFKFTVKDGASAYAVASILKTLMTNPDQAAAFIALVNANGGNLGTVDTSKGLGVTNTSPSGGAGTTSPSTSPSTSPKGAAVANAPLPSVSAVIAVVVAALALFL
eukprot:tig00000760_g3925.t1